MRIVRLIAWSGAALLAGLGIGVLSRRIEPSPAVSTEAKKTTPGADRSLAGLVVAVAFASVEDRILSVAAGVAFYAMLSLVPAISVLVSIYGLFTPVAHIPDQLDSISGLLPVAARELVREHATRLASQSNSTLSIALIFSLGLAGWTANAATKALFDGLNVMFGCAETRSFFKVNLISLALTFAGVLLMILALVTLTDVPRLLDRILVAGQVAGFIAVARWPLLFACVVAAMLVLYRSGPARSPSGRWLRLPGALAATVLWAGSSALFSWYVARIASYSAIYGSLATVVIVLTWFWLSAVILLAGGELTAQIEKRWG